MSAGDRNGKNAPINFRGGDSVHTASIIHYEYQTLIWVLIFFIVFTILFLIILLCIWCCCCRNPSQVKLWLDETSQRQQVIQAQQKTVPIERTRMHDTGDGISLMPLTSRKDRASQAEMPSSADTNGFEKGSPSTQRHNYSTRVKKMRTPHATRAILKPGLSFDTGTVYLYDSDRRSSKAKSLTSSFDDGEDDEDESNGRQGKRTEIMYIRSPPDSIDDQLENEVTSYESNARRSSLKQVKFQTQRPASPNHDATSSQNSDSGKRKRSPSNDTILSGDPVGSMERLPGASVSRTEGLRTPDSSLSSGSRTLVPLTAVSLPGAVEEPENGDTKNGERSDSDSGIGRWSKGSELNIKNKSLMEKKNIFTLAYDTVRTERIRTAESDRESL